MSQNNIYLLKRLWWHISIRRRQQFGLLLVLMAITSFAEVLSIGAILPFLGALTAPERIFETPFLKPIIQFMGITQAQDIIVPLSILFGVSVLIAGIMRLLLLWVNTRLSFAAGAELSGDIYRRTLYQSYAVHCARNSSEFIDGIMVKSNGVIYNSILPTLTLISSTLLFFGICTTLFLVSPLMTLLAFGGFATMYFLVIKFTRRRLLIYSASMARNSPLILKSLQEGLGGIRDILIDNSQKIYCDIYRNADSSFRQAQGSSLFIINMPRYAIEALGMILITILACWLILQNDGIKTAIPILGVFALGAQRLLPILQQSYASWTQISSGKIALKDTLDLLDQPLPEDVTKSAVNSIEFNGSIALKKIHFHYDAREPYLLKDINLEIPKGARVGFIGTTGSGKSTLLDIVMGLLEPNKGSLEIDGQLITAVNRRAWQAHIAHVPQTLFLTDSTIEENIAFGVPVSKVDRNQVRLAARQAKIADVIESWPDQYGTLVGERGIRLSGGQRQRIGIARALYKKANVIIFDEATSALDHETEQEVMRAIDDLSEDLTLLIIAHRLSTLKNCTQIVELTRGVISRIGSYQNILDQSIQP